MNILAIKTNETNDPNEFPTKIVHFDLETSGLSANAHILQIGAVCGEQIFHVYIHTRQNISSAASKMTQLFHKCGQLFYKNKEVETLRISDALKSFEQFLWNLSERKKNILKKISGFADSLQLFRKEMPDRKGPGKFKLKTLAKDFLQSSDNQQSSRNAADDVIILQTLTKKLLIESNELHTIISINMCKKLAINDITFENSFELYKKEGEGAIIKLFTEKVDNKSVRITKRKAIITKK
ncbi:hypothetical protein PV328_008414 [Microctonus aethiopoides]|uniref:Exonuclease domain-containing protein n=1 Tax=Microctonus aethiopoides TaxID=144406 RepID=A0AA39KR24_9HYME|nr:hypothetical protein PV328_008414 [Microctonus aethiopoides]